MTEPKELSPHDAEVSFNVSLEQSEKSSVSFSSETEADASATKGVFAIPEHVEPDARPGASLAAWTEADQVQDGDLSIDLPMIVWLRGDEPWYPEFDLDAEAVMQRLGIKRSRLTQISGKELRVGRIRMDRYIRPIFRSKDVESYLNWTRATASHQRSSSAIKEAVDALQTQGTQIAHVVEAANNSFKNAIESGLVEKLRDATIESISTVHNQLHDLDQRLQDALLTLQSGVNHTYKNLQESIDRTASIASTQSNIMDMRIDALEAANSATVLRLAEMSDKMERLWGQQSQIERYLQQHLSSMESVVETVQRLANAQRPTFRRRRTKTMRSLQEKNVITAAPNSISYQERSSRLRSKKKR